MLSTDAPAWMRPPSLSQDAPARTADTATMPPRALADRLLAPFATARGLILAVSGGPDSVALMLLAATWVRETKAYPFVHVVTVEHGLRTEAPKEATLVGSWAQQLGFSHETLVWVGDKPKQRVQERAREARYKLLLQAARVSGADHILTAHHADDQAETILFRLLRGSGPTGLAGMARNVRIADGVTLARPLLDMSKMDLVALCQTAAHPFCTDPSNENPTYARTRLRTAMPGFAAAGLDRAALLRLARRAARADTALETQASAAWRVLAPVCADGHFVADVSPLADAPTEILLRTLATAIETVRGHALPLRLDRLETLAARVQTALIAHAPLVATLGGTYLHLDRARTLRIRRENERRRGRSSGGAENLL